MTFPEQLGAFSLYAPEAGSAGWSIAFQGSWLPVLCADRDACLLVAGLVLADSVDATDRLLLELRDTYNRATPPVAVTVEHVLRHAGGAPDDEGE